MGMGGFPMVWAKAAEPAGLLCLGTTISQRQGERAAAPRLTTWIHSSPAISSTNFNSSPTCTQQLQEDAPFLLSMNFSCSLMGGGFHIWL